MTVEMREQRKLPTWQPADRRVQLIEVGVILFLIVPSMGMSFFVHQRHLNFTVTAVSVMLSDLALLSLVRYLIWRNGEPVHQIGWTFTHPWREIGWGVLLFLPVLVGTTLLEQVLHALGLSTPTKLPSFLQVTGVGQILLALLLVTIVAVVEETVFRSYLLLRFTAVMGRTSVAVVVSAAIFALGHGYEGSAGLVSIFVVGIAFACIYLWRQSLTAPIVIHFLIDFVGIIFVALEKQAGG